MLLHPGWHAVVPCDYAVTQVLLAREAGRLDLPMAKLGIEGCQSLGDLTAIPDDLSKKLMLELTSKVVNGMSFRKCAGDAGDQAALKYTGKAHWHSGRHDQQSVLLIDWVPTAQNCCTLFHKSRNVASLKVIPCLLCRAWFPKSLRTHEFDQILPVFPEGFGWVRPGNEGGH